MSRKSGSSDPVTGARRPDDIAGWLTLLKSHLALLEETAGVECVRGGLAGLSHAIGQITEEHAGMVEELLSVYEQLGVVFEVTRKLPSVRNESQVLDLFIDSLSRSFQGRDVLLVRAGADGRWHTERFETPVGAWLGARIEQAQEEQKVLVEAPPAGAMRHDTPGAGHGTPRAGRSVAQVMIAPVFAGEDFVCAIVVARRSELAEFCASDMSVIESLSTFCGDLIRNHRLVRELGEMSIAVVRSLVNAVDAKDAYTSGHSLRVAHYATLLGRKMNLGKTDLQMLQWSALLHDVGKIGIREAVLNKRGQLTEEEFGHIKEHPVRGYYVVKEVRRLADALDGVLHHHEHYDGSGYPARLARENIPLQARIIQIADVFDALTSTRSYRPAFDWRTALSIMEQEAGKTIDPHLREVFDRLMQGTLQGAPDAWERMSKRAARFTRVLGEPV